MKKNYWTILGLTSILFAIIALTTGPLFNANAFGSVPKGKSSDCLKHIFEAEETYGIPSGLLLAISLVESGKNGSPHPYALNLNGRSVYSSNIQHASQQIRLKNGKVRPNISVGCMQLQVSYHKKHFQPLDRILEPSANVDYAARFLSSLYRQTKSWPRAVKRYNGGSVQQVNKYVCKVHAHLHTLNTKSASVLRHEPCGRNSTPFISAETKRAFKANPSNMN